jgi:ADP-heptose:LPS heptosyltransferase
MAAPPFPILLIAPARVEDAILGSGLVRRLVDEVPQARFTVVAGPAVAPLFRDLPGLEQEIPFAPEPSTWDWFGLWKLVRRRRWGLVLDLQGSRFARFLSARRRAVRRPSNPASEPVHKVIEAARVLKLEDEPAPPFLFVGPERQAQAEALLKPPAEAAGPILALAPAADWVGKAWPAERFAVAAAELLGPAGPLPNGRLMLLGRAEDRWASETVRRAISRERLIDLVGRLDWLTAYACLQRARLFIGNEGPLVHLAAAAGAPTLALFGPSDERLHAPWGSHTRVVRGPRDFEAFRRIDPGFNQAVCHMQDLSTARVTAAARELVAATEPAPADGDGHD